MMKRRLPLLLILVGGVSLIIGCRAGVEPSKRATGEQFPLVELTESEQAKLDPLLKQLLAVSPIDAEFSGVVEELSEVISMHVGGPKPNVDVLIKTTDKAKELSDLGISIQSRIGDIVTANLPIERLPEVARLESVVYIEAAKVEKL